MTIVCIVGSSKVREDLVVPVVRDILSRYDVHGDYIISGGAKGVDTCAIMMARSMGFDCDVFWPERKIAEDYLERNRRMASMAGHIFVIAVRGSGCYHHGRNPDTDHDRTGGCYTAARCRTGIHNELIIVDPVDGCVISRRTRNPLELSDQGVERFYTPSIRQFTREYNLEYTPLSGMRTFTSRVIHSVTGRGLEPNIRYS